MFRICHESYVVKRVVRGQHWCDTGYKKYLSNGENAEENILLVIGIIVEMI